MFIWIEINEFSIAFKKKSSPRLQTKNVRRRPNADQMRTKCGDMAHDSLLLFDGVNEVTATENAQIIIADVVISNSFS